MSSLYETKYIEAYHDVDDNLPMFYWKTETKLMEDDDFKQEITQIANQ